MKSGFIRLVLSYLRFLAKVSIAINKPRIVGVAGSAGKSSARNALYAIFKDHYNTKMVYGNSETGIPLGILGIVPAGYSGIEWIRMLIKAPFGVFFLQNTKYLIVEMGIDDPFPPKNMEYLLSIIKPHVAINLNVSATHTQQFEKILPKTKLPENERMSFLLHKIAEEDTKIISKSNCERGIINADDDQIVDVLASFPKQKLFSFGKKESNDISYKSYNVTLEGTEFAYQIKSKGKIDKIHILFPGFVLPKVYEGTIASAILTAFLEGITLQKIKKSLENNFSLPKGRATIFQGKNDSVIIDSSYNASRNATISFLELALDLKKKYKREIVFVFGDMNELGVESTAEHKIVAEKISTVADRLYCVGPITKKVVVPYVKKLGSVYDVRHFATSEHLQEYFDSNTPSNSIVLVKGSQNRVFLEEAIKGLLKNEEDSKKLCRQEKFWMNTKNKYFDNQRIILSQSSK